VGVSMRAYICAHRYTQNQDTLRVFPPPRLVDVEGLPDARYGSAKIAFLDAVRRLSFPQEGINSLP
jgi:hypothetical protein